VDSPPSTTVCTFLCRNEEGVLSLCNQPLNELKQVDCKDKDMKRIYKPKPQIRRPRPQPEPLVTKLDLLSVLRLK
jgi:hypothetical protein